MDAFEQLESSNYLKLTKEKKELLERAVCNFTLLTALEEKQGQTEQDRQTIAYLKRDLDRIMKDPDVRQYMEEYCMDNLGPNPRLWIPKHLGIDPFALDKPVV